MPVVRLHFSTPIRASSLPSLSVSPALATQWQQIGPNEVQAVAIGQLQPLVRYTVDAPTMIRCAPQCSFEALRPYDTSVATNINWEQQLLATLHYLPLTFAPIATLGDPAQQTTGTFAWAYRNLPLGLSQLWHQGTSGVILTGAVMAFQNDHQLATTGIADSATWTALVSAVQHHKVDTHPYSYVEVTTSEPQHLTLYVSGAATFHSLVNTGISVSPTQLGTFPVYLRYVTQTMSGKNPDGTRYHDPGIPWISYFNGGDALHGFIRATYGWPQSLGCVEMPFAAAKSVWPFTPIGTLVHVQ